MDSEALLGPLPRGWFVQQRLSGGRWLPQYYNNYTNETTIDDPRLPPLPGGWQRVNKEPTVDDPEHPDFFENKDTEEIINYDPRMSISALEQRGVKLESVILV